VVATASSSRRTFLVLERTGLGVEVLARRNPLVVQPGERGHELAPLAPQRGLEVPIRGRPERPPLLFPFDDEADGDALHASGAEAGLHLLPQHGRERVAVEPVEDAAALLGANQVLVDLGRMLERLVDGVLGDLVEGEAAAPGSWAAAPLSGAS
jgi:hypothetical protein